MPPIILLSTPISPKYKLDGFPFDNTISINFDNFNFVVFNKILIFLILAKKQLFLCYQYLFLRAVI